MILKRGVGDLALEWTEAGADLVIRDDDLLADEGLRTAVLLSLFTDRRAEDDDPLPAEDGDRRGWWGDEFATVEGDRFGSRLWLLDRSKRLADVAQRAEEFADEALAWMLEDRVAERVDVTAETEGNSLCLAVSIQRPGADPVSFRFDHVWRAEAARSVSIPAVRFWPASGSEWAALPVIGKVTVPSSLWTLQGDGLSAPEAPDGVASVDLTGAGGLDYRQPGDAGRFAVEVGVGERLAAASAATYDLDDVTSLSLLIHAFVPATLASERTVGGKRGGTGLPGYGFRIDDVTGAVSFTVDAGVSAVSPEVALDHRGQWGSFLGVIDRALNEGRIHTPLGTATLDISALGTLTSTGVLSLGSMAGVFNPEPGTLLGYAAIWEGVALTQADYDAITGGQP